MIFMSMGNVWLMKSLIVEVLYLRIHILKLFYIKYKVIFKYFLHCFLIYSKHPHYKKIKIYFSYFTQKNSHFMSPSAFI